MRGPSKKSIREVDGVRLSSGVEYMPTAAIPDSRFFPAAPYDSDLRTLFINLEVTPLPLCARELSSSIESGLGFAFLTPYDVLRGWRSWGRPRARPGSAGFDGAVCGLVCRRLANRTSSIETGWTL